MFQASTISGEILIMAWSRASVKVHHRIMVRVSRFDNGTCPSFLYIIHNIYICIPFPCTFHFYFVIFFYTPLYGLFIYTYITYFIVIYFNKYMQFWDVYLWVRSSGKSLCQHSHSVTLCHVDVKFYVDK